MRVLDGEKQGERKSVCLCLATGTVDACSDLAGLGCRTHTRQRSIRVLRHGAHHGAKRSSCCPSEKVGAGFLSESLRDGPWANLDVSEISQCMHIDACLFSVMHFHPHPSILPNTPLTFLAPGMFC